MSYVNSFKKRHGITSRRITAHVNKVSFEEKEQLMKTATDWAEKIKNMIIEHGYAPMYIFNADQSGFNYELVGKRSLAYVGEDRVEKVVQSKNATKHSFTILPLISMAGIVHKKMLVTFQEANGQFSENVWAGMIHPPNLVITATRSGIMNYDGLDMFVERILGEATSSTEPNLVLLDGWPPFKNHARIQEKLPEDKDVRIENVPDNCTPFVQPWDVYGAGPWKNYEKKLEHFLKLSNEEFRIPTRNNKIICMSILHNQMSSRRYIGLYEYACY
jgi:hypothetical protein